MVWVNRLFGRGAVVSGHIFSERLYDRVRKGQFVVYAVVGDCLLERLGYHDAGAVVFALFVFRCHALQHELVCALHTHGRTYDYVVAVLCAYVNVRVSV